MPSDHDVFYSIHYTSSTKTLSAIGEIQCELYGIYATIGGCTLAGKEP